MKARLVSNAAVMTLLLPGTVTVLIPYFILPQSCFNEWPGISAVAVAAMIAGLSGLAGLLHCIWGFAVYGKGTLAPIDPPKLLVVRGLYKYTRNPMYSSVVIVLLSEALLFGSPSLLVYAAMVLLGFHLFVIFYEEPRLRSQFGRSYEEYCKTISRWGITIRRFRSEERANEP